MGCGCPGQKRGSTFGVCKSKYRKPWGIIGKSICFGIKGPTRPQNAWQFAVALYYFMDYVRSFNIKVKFFEF
jgi:hypothetical protein